MHTENFLNLTTVNGNNVSIAKTSIALVEDNGGQQTTITLKEKRQDGKQIVLTVLSFYMTILQSLDNKG